MILLVVVAFSLEAAQANSLKKKQSKKNKTLIMIGAVAAAGVAIGAIYYFNSSSSQASSTPPSTPEPQQHPPAVAPAATQSIPVADLPKSTETPASPQAVAQQTIQPSPQPTAQAATKSEVTSAPLPPLKNDKPEAAKPAQATAATAPQKAPEKLACIRHQNELERATPALQKAVNSVGGLGPLMGTWKVDHVFANTTLIFQQRPEGLMGLGQGTKIPDDISGKYKSVQICEVAGKSNQVLVRIPREDRSADPVELMVNLESTKKISLAIVEKDARNNDFYSFNKAEGAQAIRSIAGVPNYGAR